MSEADQCHLCKEPAEHCDECPDCSEEACPTCIEERVCCGV